MADRPDWKDRELEILAQLALGLTDRAIAARLGLSFDTVRWYNKKIYDKLGVSGRTQAVRRATALGLLDVGPPASAAAAPSPAPPVRSPICYVVNDGVSVAYQVIGEGPVDLLFVHGFLSHLEVAWEDPEFTAFFETLGRCARVILFDKRGVGLSDRIQGAPTLDDTLSDARRILDAVGSTRTFVMGTSEGGAAAVLLASMHPERVAGLILYGATPTVVRRGEEPTFAASASEFAQRIQMMQQTWGQPWALERFAPSRMHDEAFRAWWSRVLRAASSPSSVRAVMEAVAQVDIRPLLPHVPTRTLVVHRTGDAVAKVEAGRHLASHLPKATLLELPGADHIYFVGGADLARAVVEFIGRADGAAPLDTWIAVILCMAGSGSSLAEEKRRVLDTFRARQVRATARGWTALFDAPQRALRCARELQALGRGRVGGMALHVGACGVSDGLPLPAALESAQRLAEAAAPGELIVSGTLHDILAAGDISLTPRVVPGDDGAGPISAWSLVA